MYSILGVDGIVGVGCPLSSVSISGVDGIVETSRIPIPGVDGIVGMRCDRVVEGIARSVVVAIQTWYRR